MFRLFRIEKDSKNKNYYFMGIRIYHKSRRSINLLLDDLRRNVLSLHDITKVPPAKGFLRDAQFAVLEIYKEVARVAHANKCCFWADCGTLLGAIRHGGYIPWDDDMDLGMLRKDWIRFPDLFNAQTHNGFFAEWHYDGQWNMIKVKHCDIPHLSVDIFVYDEVDIQLPSYADKKLLSDEIAKEQRCLFAKHLDMEEKKEKLEQLLAQVIQRQKLHRDSRCISPLIIRGVEMLGTLNNTVHDKVSIFPLAVAPFEGINIPIPCNPDMVLIHEYGDYNAWPVHLFPLHGMSSSVATTENALKTRNFLKRYSMKECVGV